MGEVRDFFTIHSNGKTYRDMIMIRRYDQIVKSQPGVAGFDLILVNDIASTGV